MATFRFPVISGVPLEATLADLPAGLKSHLEGGFHLLATIPVEKYKAILKTVSELYESTGGLRETQIAASLGISEEQVGPLLSASGMLVFEITNRGVSIEKILQTTTETGLVREEDKAGIAGFTEAISKSKNALQQAYRRSRLASAILPSFDSFETTVDLRAEFQKEKVVSLVPVVIAHLDTDAHQQELWFQLSQSQLEALTDDLQKALRRVKEIGAWAEKKIEEEG